ncbi:MAG: ERAP1-like C-terminal domain-containing protein [Acidobacteriia bacterium]|nr:ERAP1-like C-terminal domain-containing protein [Terriglobia bacterium]
MPTRHILRRIVLFILLFTTGAISQAPVGIPRDLARLRAQQLKDVRYQLSFTITPKSDSVSGHEELRFVQNADDRGILPEWLDFREGSVSSLTVNGQPASTEIQNGHVELPAKLLKLDENVVVIDFKAPVAPAGKAITRFEDKDDGSEYIYTLFVPMDAEMAFPCFDQPDLKAKFKLKVDAPAGWVVISNTSGVMTVTEVTDGPVGPDPSVPQGHGFTRTEFTETQPISTYLFAFAAGPFQKVHDTPGLPGLYVRKSKLQKAEAEAEAAAVQQITADGIKYLSDYFAHPFPFPKYDMVMIPGFAYGGMEHAGATFLREESILFRTAPTHSDRLNRDILLLHELTHQWFGDLVTMRWFDDLWLKEGFAQYMAYHALNSLKPNENVWKRFYQAIKPAAYAIDSTQGTTPIYQDIPNLKDAKSAYGAIVYSKAPGVIKQLAFVVGEDQFRDGLRLYLKEHAYANAEWNDLVRALERTSKKPLGPWADAWIRRRGMPQVDVEWACGVKGDLTATRVTVSQKDVLAEGGLWPIATKVLVNYGKTETQTRIEWKTAKTEFITGKGGACPRYVFANYQDEAYGRFLLDPVSRKAVMADLGSMNDVFKRTLFWGSLWDSVREAEMDPRDYINLALRNLPTEKDESLAQSIIGRTITALHRYVSTETREQLAPKMEALAADQMLQSPSQDMRITWFRALRGVAETEKARAQLKDMLNGKLTVPGVELRTLDRWNIVESLVAQNDPDAPAVLAAEEKRDPSGDGKKYAYMAAAARPDAETKKHYFDEYLHDTSRPEDWIEISLGSFNWWNQSDLTLPYLGPALDALPQVKRERKIFFMLAWLNAFIGGQQSAAAQKQVHDLLDKAELDKDLRLKILEVVDELDRTVKIRAKYR